MSEARYTSLASLLGEAEGRPVHINLSGADGYQTALLTQVAAEHCLLVQGEAVIFLPLASLLCVVDGANGLTLTMRGY